MEQTNKYYPKFEEGQVLTSKALNSYFAYLDEQERLTRAQLLGIGIINGLDFKYNDGVICITKGTAVTSDGYLIELDSDTTYTLAVEYRNGMLSQKNPLSDCQDDTFSNTLQHVSFVLYKDANDAQLHGQLIQAQDHPLPNQEEMENYILALSVDFISQDNVTKCNELSCDIIQTNFHTEIRPVLINKKNLFGDNTQLSWFLANFQYTAQLDTSLKLDFTSPKKDKDEAFILERESVDEAMKKKFNELCGFISNTFDLYKTYCVYNGNVFGCAADIITAIVGLFVELFGGSSSTSNTAVASEFTPTPAWMLLISNPNETFSRLKDVMTKISKLKDPTTNIPDYYILFLNDVILAIDEFITFYNEFAGKYDMLPVYNTNYNRIVMLGSGQNSDCNPFRQYNNSFLHSKQFIADRALLEKHVLRIIVLIENFIFEKDYKPQETQIKIIRQKSHAKLGERFIPYYYKKSSQLQAIWNAHSNFDVMRFRHFEQLSNTSSFGGYNNLFTDETTFRVESYSSDVYVIQGYYGHSFNDLRDALSSYNKSYKVRGIWFNAKHLDSKIKQMGQVDKDLINIYDKCKDVLCHFTNQTEWKNVFNGIIESKKVSIIQLRNVFKGFMHAFEYKNEELTFVKDVLKAYAYSSYYLQHMVMIGGCPNDGELVCFCDNENKVYLCVGLPNMDTIDEQIL